MMLSIMAGNSTVITASMPASFVNGENILYIEYLIVHNIPKGTFGDQDDSLECVTSATTWNDIIKEYIRILDHECPSHKELHQSRNLIDADICYIMNYNEVVCPVCESWYIVPVPKDC